VARGPSRRASRAIARDRGSRKACRREGQGRCAAARRALPAYVEHREAAVAALREVGTRRDLAHVEATGGAGIEYIEAEVLPAVEQLRAVLAPVEGLKAALFERANATVPAASGAACQIADAIKAVMHGLVVVPDVPRGRGFLDRLGDDPAAVGDREMLIFLIERAGR
jgi:hypothetical protein